MKYVVRALLEVKWLLVCTISVMFLYQYNNAQLLKFIHLAVEESSTSNYVSYVIMALIADTILDTILSRSRAINHYFYTSLNNRLCDKVLDVEMSAFETFSVAKVATMRDNNFKIAQLVWTVIQFVSAVTSVVINAYVICTISKIALIPMLLIGLILGSLLYYMNNRWAQIDKEFNKEAGLRNTELTEVTYGYAEVRSFGTRETHRKSLRGRNESILGLSKTRILTSQIMTALVDSSSSVLSVLGLLYVITLVKDGVITSSIAVTLILYLWRITRPFCTIISTFSEISEYKAAVPLFEKFMDYENRVVDGTISLESFNDKIEIKDMDFYYDSSNNVLQNINMEIRKGERVGICGESGGGKSTLIKLLLRFYDPTSGAISIDGIDIKKLGIDSYRSHIGVVSQDTHIFEGSIRDNIAYALKAKTSQVPEEEIIRVCKQAKLWDFISKLKDGLDTDVGPNGLKLSGGQKQRISIARILLKDPDIILLDEATSALDNETEKCIKETLDMLNGKTIVAVAHRLTTIKDFDKIYVFDNK